MVTPGKFSRSPTRTEQKTSLANVTRHIHKELLAIYGVGPKAIRIIEQPGTGVRVLCELRNIDELTVTWQASVEGQRNGACLLHVRAVDRLNMKVRFGAVPRVAAASQQGAAPHVLAGTHPEAALLKVAQGEYESVSLDQHVVAGEPGPARSGPTLLRQGVPKGRQATVGVVIGFAITGHNHDTVTRRQHRAPESWELLGWFTARE